MIPRGQILPKSLHTITVLQNVAAYRMDNDASLTPAKAIKEALVILKLEDKPDPHALASTARDKLATDRKMGKQQ